MLDFFTILSKGGFVLWCYTLQGVKVNVQESVNALIKNVILQERSGSAQFSHGSLTIKYKLDNEFELLFVVGYQKFLQLSYVDKLIDDVHRRFRDAHKQNLLSVQFSTLIRTDFDFGVQFKDLLKIAESHGVKPKTMQTFEQSAKSSKTVDSLKIDSNKKEEKSSKKKKNKKSKANKAAAGDPVELEVVEEVDPPEETNQAEDEIARNRELFKMKQFGQIKPKSKASPKPGKKVKGDRKWGDKISKEEALMLNYSDAPVTNGIHDQENGTKRFTADDQTYAGTAVGDIKALEYEEEEVGASEAQSSGMFSMFKGLVGAKALTQASLKPVLDKMMDHLIGKNVATDIAEKLCQSVSAKLEGKALGTFGSVTSTVRQCVQETLVQILTPKRRVDILRDVLDAQRNNKPYVITFCGVNGVGKSTNLAKVCFWLLENGFNVLVAACDTFRAGAVEQLRTHTVRLNTIHPSETGKDRVGLFEKGYGKDAAGIAMQAITYAAREQYHVVLVDTAGRMQDNEPLMRSLAKLISVNQPDLVLFVGEALVGNEAVDQLTKFNQALADYSQMENPRLIDGIVLTKFDTIDDKVGAAISMTYTTGQPIVFVGTGQCYPDLRSLNAQTVVQALLK